MDLDEGTLRSGSVLKANNVYNLVAQTAVVAVQIGVLFANSGSMRTLLTSDVRTNLVWIGTTGAVVYALIWTYVTPKVFSLAPSQDKDYWVMGSVAGTGMAFASLLGGIFLIANGGAMPS